MKAARIHAGYSQKTAAILLNISKSTLSNYENYRTIPDAKTSGEMAKLYGISADHIIFYK